MKVCYCIKDYSFNDSFKVGEQYYYHVDLDGYVFVHKYPFNKYATELFISLDDFHKYFKDC